MTDTVSHDERLLSGYTGRMIVLLTLGFLAMQLVRRVLPPLLPVIIDDLGITALEAGIAMTLLEGSRAFLQYPSGRLSDQLSRKTVLLASVGLVLGGLVVLAGTTSYLVWLVGIAVFGATFGLYDPADRALLSDLFEEKRGKAFGLHMIAGDLAGIIAAGLTVVVAAVATWRTAFLPSILLLAPVLAGLYYWNREPIVVSSVEFEVGETGRRLLGDPRVRLTIAAYALFIFASSGVIAFLPTFLSASHGMTFAAASGAFAGVYAVGVVVKPAAGWLSDRLPRPLVAGGAMLLTGASLGLLVVAPTVGVVAIAVFGYAVGQRAFPAPMQAYLMDVFPDESKGGDIGAARTVYKAVGALGPAYVGFVVSTAGYVPAYATVVAAFLGAGALVLWLERV